MLIDIEALNDKARLVYTRKFDEPTIDCVEKYKGILYELGASIDNNNPIETLRQLKSKYKFNGKNSFLLNILNILKNQNQSPKNEDTIRDLLRIKRGKSESGVLVITVFTSPYPEWVDEDGTVHVQKFTCRNDCHYCPKEPGQPRSYLQLEPGVLRANKNKFNTCEQMWDRMHSLSAIGHPVDKLEVLVLGGTWSHYPQKYQETFIRDIYYSANTFTSAIPRRQPLALSEEKQLNRLSQAKVIGLTLESRPDAISPTEIVRLRLYGCTRIQIGIQHTHDDILRLINRGCTHQDTINAIKMLKDSGFKVEIHTMPNLPGSSPDKDKDMYNALTGQEWPPIPKRWETNNVLWEQYRMRHPDLQVDGWKIYPCTVVPWTQIEEWYNSKTYIPYPDQLVEDLLLEVLPQVPEWVRLNRIIRDISGDYIICGVDTNLRNTLESKLKEEGKQCRCIRCREVKSSKWAGSYQMVVRQFESSSAQEFFISAEDPTLKTLYAFLRLRLPPHSPYEHPIFPELSNCALLRELHVYGRLQTTDNSHKQSHVQHKGLGAALINLAKQIAADHKYQKIAVIPGEGVREYYKMRGFLDAPGKGNFMIANTRN